MSPTLRLLQLASAWTVLAVLVAAVPSTAIVWQGIGVVALLVVLTDMILLRGFKPLEIQRRLPGRFALGEPGEVRLTLRNPGRQTARLELFDGIPQGAEAETMPWSGEIPPQR